MNKIDFVVTWVDSNDKKWIKEKEKYNPEKNTDTSIARYRDWDTLKYWFRGVEKYAPWVNKIYLITYGHVPKWLNLNNPKLVIVKHEDYMDKKYLPTFNSIPIELNMHKIKGLSEKFVYFNDDVFLIKDTKPTDFFKNDLPCDSAILMTSTPVGENRFYNTLSNNTYIVNKYFNLKEVLRKNPFKWINLKYGSLVMRTLILSLWNNFVGFKNLHLAVSYKKSTFEKVWNLEHDYLDDICYQKFRNNSTSVNHMLMEDYQFVTGEFYPRNIKFGKLFEIGDDNKKLFYAIKKQKYKCICINDIKEVDNIEKIKKEIQDCLCFILPEKCSFEL